jgi:hypothetical protein
MGCSCLERRLRSAHLKIGSGLIQTKQRADFAAAQPVDMKFVEVVCSAIYEKLANILVPKSERQFAGNGLVSEVRGIIVVRLRKAIQK